MSLTREAEQLIAEKMAALKAKHNEEGMFYQRKSFVDHIEDFLKILECSVEKVNNRKKEIKRLIAQDAANEVFQSEKKKWYWIQKQNEMMLSHTINMIRHLGEQKKSSRLSMYQYGLKMRELLLSSDEIEFNAEAKRLSVETLGHAGTGLDLSSLDEDCHTISIFFLDKEIKRADDLKSVKYFTTEKYKQHSEFVDSLKTLRKTVLEDLNSMKEAKYKTVDIQDSTSSQLAMSATNMLEQMSYEEEKQDNDIAIVKQHADNQPSYNKLEKFCKAAGVFAAMISATLGFVLGAAYGFVVGAVYGAQCCLIGAIPSSVISAGVAGVATAECAYEGVKNLVGIPPYESIKRHLLFQPGAKEVAQHANKKTMAFLNPLTKTKPKTAEKSTNEINPEVLGRYFSYR